MRIRIFVALTALAVQKMNTFIAVIFLACLDHCASVASAVCGRSPSSFSARRDRRHASGLRVSRTGGRPRRAWHSA